LAVLDAKSDQRELQPGGRVVERQTQYRIEIHSSEAGSHKSRRYYLELHVAEDRPGAGNRIADRGYVVHILIRLAMEHRQGVRSLPGQRYLNIGIILLPIQ